MVRASLLLVLAGLMAVPCPAWSKRVKGGALKLQQGEVTWKDTVKIRGDVIVPEGGALLIEPGTRIIIEEAKNSLVVEGRTGHPGVDIYVMGSIKAAGTAGAPIVFEAEGEWGGIDLVGQYREHQLAFTTISNAAVALDATGAPLRVISCTFAGNKTGLIARGGRNLVERCSFTGNEVGLRFRDGPLQATGCVFRGNQASLVEEPGPATMVDVSILGCSFLGNERHVVLEQGCTEERILLYNWWGTTDEAAILSRIIDGRTKPGRGRVTLFPFLTGPGSR